MENPEPEYNINKIIEDYTDNKLNVEQIKAKYGISKSQWEHAIIRELKEHNVPLRQINFNVVENTPPRFDIEAVIHDYTSTDLTVKEIQDKHGITRSQWKNLMKKFHKQGVPIRKRGRHPKKRRRIQLHEI